MKTTINILTALAFINATALTTYAAAPCAPGSAKSARPVEATKTRPASPASSGDRYFDAASQNWIMSDK